MRHTSAKDTKDQRVYASSSSLIKLPVNLWRIHAQVHDDPELGAWVHRMRKLHKEGHLWDEWIQALDDLDFKFKIKTVTAKWHYCFHEARRYKVWRLCSLRSSHIACVADVFKQSTDVRDTIPTAVTCAGLL